MNLYILSMRDCISTVAYDTIFELEDILVDTCQGQILKPIPTSTFLSSYGIKWKSLQNLSQKILKRTVGCYYIPNLSLSNGSPNVLLAIAMYGGQLDMLSSIPDWRKKFDLVIAYVFDSWIYEGYSQNVKDLDCLFVPIPEVIEPLKQRFQIPVFFIPFGADVLKRGSNRLERPIDLMSFGRIPDRYHFAFSDRFHRLEADTLYYRPKPRSRAGFPISLDKQLADKQDSLYLSSMLSKSKLMLAFDTLEAGMREFPVSVVTLRWFFGLAAGCAIVGKAPTAPVAKELLSWENATIELPDDPLRSCEFIEELLKDKYLLHSIHQRNYREAISRHDWRYRIRDIFNLMNLPLPQPLTQQLSQLDVLLQETVSN